MTKYRQLTKEEKSLIKKQLIRLKADLNYDEYLLRYNTLMLDEGLHQNYLNQVKEFKDKKRKLEGEIESTKFIIDEMNIQIKKGVEQKEEVNTEE